MPQINADSLKELGYSYNGLVWRHPKSKLPIEPYGHLIRGKNTRSEHDIRFSWAFGLIRKLEV